MDSTKIQTIMDWLEPRKVKDIQSFLGFANFYCHFISDYSKIVVLLTRLTCKGTQWNFTDEAQKSFNSLKANFTSTLVLTNWEPDKPLISRWMLPTMHLVLSSPSSLTLVISILSLSIPKLSPLPKKTMIPMTKSYSPFLMLSRCGDTTWWVPANQLMWSLIIKTLSIFSTTKILTHWQVQWSEFLSGFNLVIRFRPGQLSDRNEIVLHGDTKFHFSIYPIESCMDYSWACKDHWC